MLLQISLNSSSKSFEFSPNQPVIDLLHHAKSSFNEPISDDSGLFLTRLRQWLDMKRCLDFYDIVGGDVVEIKKKHRFLRVKLVDETIKTILVDETLPVSDISTIICDHVGLSNPDEYSLQAESDIIEQFKKDLNESSGNNSSNASLDRNRKNPGTLSRKKKSSKDNLSGPNRLVWLNPDKRLPEQGIQQSELVYLKKKFFYSDKSISRNDPVQVNLVYVQSRDMIVAGDIPCNIFEACQLAALQCHIQFGNYVSSKHKAGFFKLKDFVPTEYLKDKKSMEKRIIKEFSKLKNINENNAKFRYVQLCRSLKTYGITFFRVEEQVKVKSSQTVERLLGITKDTVLRVDKDSKEIMQSWPMNTLRRWAAAPNSITLDFGDYSNSYYTVQTTEGEQISRLLAGYIDLIIKKRSDTSADIVDGNGEIAIAQESIRPARAAGVSINSSNGQKARDFNVATSDLVSDSAGKLATQKSGILGNIGKSKAQKSFVASPSHHAIMQSINSGFAAMNIASSELKNPSHLPPLGNDQASQNWKRQTIDFNKEKVAALIGSQLASTASIVSISTIGDPESINDSLLTPSIGALGANLVQISSSAKLIAGLQDPSKSENLISASESLSIASSDLLSQVQNYVMSSSSDKTAQKKLVESGYSLSKASFSLLNLLGEGEVSEPAQKEIFQSAKTVASATTQFISQGVRPIADKCKSLASYKKLEPKILDLSKSVAAAAENLLSCCVITAPSLGYNSCQEVILSNTLTVKDIIAEISEICKPIQLQIDQDSPIIPNYERSLQLVNESIAVLMDKSKNATQLDDETFQLSGEERELDGYFDSAENALEDLWTNRYNRDGLVSSSHDLSLCINQIGNMLLKNANKVSDNSEKSRLLDGKKYITECANEVFEIVKQYSADPSLKPRFQNAIKKLHGAMTSVSGNRARIRTINRLAKAAKQSLASHQQLEASVKTASSSNRDQEAQILLNYDLKKASIAISPLSSAIKAYTKNPREHSSQLKLLIAAKQAAVPFQVVVSSSKSNCSSIGDKLIRKQLVDSTKIHSTEVKKLLHALELAETSSAGLEMENAIESLSDSRSIIEHTLSGLKNGTIDVNYINPQNSSSTQMAKLKNLTHESIAHLVAASRQGNERFAGNSARDAGANFHEWLLTVKDLCLNLGNDPKSQKELLISAEGLAKQLEKLFVASKKSLSISNSLNSSDQDVLEAHNSLDEALSLFDRISTDFVRILPGQKSIENALKLIKEGKRNILDAKKSGSDESPESAMNKLNSAVASFSVAGNAIVTSAKAGNALEMHQSAEKFGHSFEKLVEACKVTVTHADSSTNSEKIVGSFNEISEVSSKFLEYSKQTIADPSTFSDALTECAKELSFSVGKLVESCGNGNPNLSLCNQADHKLSGALNIIDSIPDSFDMSQPSNYSDCLKDATVCSKELGNLLSVIISAYKEFNGEKLSKNVLLLSNCVQKLAESSASACYILGMGDNGSTSAHPSSIDTEAILDSAHAVRQSVKQILKNTTDYECLIEKSKIMANNTSKLCEISSKSSQLESFDSITRDKLAKCAREIAISTSSVGSLIKELMNSPNDFNISDLADNSKSMLKEIDNLVAVACSITVSPTQTEFNPINIQKMRPLTNSNKSLISFSQEIVSLTKTLLSTSEKEIVKKSFKPQIQGLTDSLKELLSFLRESAPGYLEYSQSIEKVNNGIVALDSSLIQAEVGTLNENDAGSSSEKSLKESLLLNFHAVNSSLNAITKDVKGGKNNMGGSVAQLSNNVDSIISNAIKYASSLRDSKKQKVVIEDIKRISEDSLQFFESLRDFDTDISFENTYHSARTNFEKSVQSVAQKLEGNSSNTAEISKAINELHKFIKDAERGEFNETMETLAQNGITYPVSFQNLNKKTKKFVDNVGQILAISSTPTSKFASKISDSIVNSFAELAEKCNASKLLLKDAKTKEFLGDNLSDVGSATVYLLETLKDTISSSDGSKLDSASKKQLINSVRALTNVVAKLSDIAKEGSKSAQVCENAIQQINDISNDLESASIFAEAGQMDSLDPSLSLVDVAQKVDRLGRELVGSSKILVANSASGNDEEMAAVVKNMVSIFSDVNEKSKKLASLVTSADVETQVDILNVTKKSAEALNVFLSSSIEASGKPMKLSATGSIAAGTMVLPEILKLRDAAKNFVQSINSLIKFGSSLCNEKSRGARSIENTLRELQNVSFKGSDKNSFNGTALPDDVVSMAKLFLNSTHEMLSCFTRYDGSNQDLIVNSTTDIKRHVLELLRAGKAASFKAPEEKRDKMNSSLKSTVESLSVILNSMLESIENHNSPKKGDFSSKMEAIIDNVNDIQDAAKDFDPEGYFDRNDPNIKAEREIASISASIEGYSRQIAELNTKSNGTKIFDEKSFEYQIIDGSRSICSSATALMKSITQTVREVAFISQTENSKLVDRDESWTNSLISGSKSIMSAVNELLDAAQKATRGEVQASLVIAGARNVNSATISLLTSASVKSNSKAANNIRIKASARSVTQASEKLIKTAEQSIAFEEAVFMPDTKGTNTTTLARAKEIDAQARVLQMERELEIARKRLAGMRRNRSNLGSDEHIAT